MNCLPKHVLIFLFVILFTRAAFGLDQKNSYSYFGTNSDISLANINNEIFLPLENGYLNTSDKYKFVWLKIRIDSSAFVDNEMLFWSSNQIICRYKVYMQYYTKLDSSSFSIYESNSNKFALPTALVVTKDVKEIYLKSSNNFLFWDQYNFTTQRQFFKSRTIDLIIYAITIGILFIIALYNLVLFFYSKKYLRLFYFIFMFTQIGVALHLSGMGTNYIWSNMLGINYYIELLLLSVMVVFFCLFFILILQVKKLSKLLFYTFILTAFFSCFCLLIGVLVNREVVIPVISALPLVCIILAIVGSIINIEKGYKEGKLVLFGWSLFFLFHGNLALSRLGILNGDFFTAHYLAAVGTIFESIIFTVVMSKYLINTESKNLISEQNLALTSDKLDVLEQLLKESINTEKVAVKNLEVIDINIDGFIYKPLTDREKEVLVNLANGLTYKEIAAKLFVSHSTVKTHVMRMYSKLEVKNRTEAINKAVNLKIV